MPRYSFHIEGPDHGGGVGDDPFGIDYPTNASAFDYAKQIIRELKNAGGYDKQGLMMVVKPESGRRYSPFRLADLKRSFGSPGIVGGDLLVCVR